MQNEASPLVLVTGSTGLLGSRIVSRLADEHRVVGMDVKRPEDDAGLEAWLECDLTSDESVREALDRVRERFGEDVVAVVHLAAYYDFSGEPSPLYDELTVEGTRRLLRGLKRFRVEQFLFSSSLLVMEPVEAGDSPLTERSPVRAEWEYPRSKLDTEELLRAEHGEIPISVLRIAGVYTDRCRSIPIGQQIKRIWERSFESHFFPGNPEHGQSFVHLDDVVEAVALSVAKRGDLDEEELFLVGEPEVVSYGELQDLIGELVHGEEWATLRIPGPMAKAGAWLRSKLPGGEKEFIKPWMIDQADAHYPVDPSRARERLGWTPEHDLRSTVPSMVRSLQEEPVAWYREHGLPDPEEAAEHGPGR